MRQRRWWHRLVVAAATALVSVLIRATSGLQSLSVQHHGLVAKELAN